jgi:hypothetical protein
MFRDPRQQQTRALRALLSTVRLENLWTSEGPTAEAVELLRGNGGHLSSSETIFLRAAFDFWSGKGGCEFGRMLHTLDHDLLEAILSLALAVSDITDSFGAIDRWLARYERAPLPSVRRG